MVCNTLTKYSEIPIIRPQMVLVKSSVGSEHSQ